MTLHKKIQCEADMLAGEVDSKFCVNEKFRTLNGGGPFDPTDNSEDGCLKINMESHNAKDQCCGQYPGLKSTSKQ